MAKRITKERKYITLPEETIRRVDSMVAGWSYDTKAFVRSRLNQYSPPHPLISSVKEGLHLIFLMRRQKKRMNVLNNLFILRDWKKRFLYSGETNPGASWNRIIEKELTKAELLYLIAVLDRELTDLHVPVELEESSTRFTGPISARSTSKTRMCPKPPSCWWKGPQAPVRAPRYGRLWKPWSSETKSSLRWTGRRKRGKFWQTTASLHPWRMWILILP